MNRLSPQLIVRRMEDQSALDNVKPCEDCDNCASTGQNEDETLCRCVTKQVDAIVKLGARTYNNLKKSSEAKEILQAVDRLRIKQPSPQPPLQLSKVRMN